VNFHCLHTLAPRCREREPTHPLRAGLADRLSWEQPSPAPDYDAHPKGILNTGGTVRIYVNIDPGPYQRMQKKGWLTGQQVGKREAVYEITEAGRAIIADLSDSA
jgi:hypothetical protein